MADAMPTTSQGGGGDTEEEQPVELIHGVSQLPDGYGKIFNAAAMLPQCCLNALENAVNTRNKMLHLFLLLYNAA